MGKPILVATKFDHVGQTTEVRPQTWKEWEFQREMKHDRYEKDKSLEVNRVLLQASGTMFRQLEAETPSETRPRS